MRGFQAKGVSIAAATTMMLALGLQPATHASPRSPANQLDMDFVRRVKRHLTTIGSTPLGFRVLGTPQDEETARYVADQMTSIGLEDVTVETFSGDGWLFGGGSIEAHGSGLDRTFKASSLGGMPGTEPGGVTGQIVVLPSVAVPSGDVSLTVDPEGRPAGR